ncbi:MAG: DsbA family oxidoreductase [Planctomycetota bacterium]
MSRLTVDIWSDIACPWCYVGKRRFEAALARFPERGSVDVHWRSFELDTAAPRVLEPAVPYAERLARKYRRTLPEAEGMLRDMTQTAAAEGLELRFDRVRPGNTFDAHRLLHLAAAKGLGDALKERFLRAYMTEGEPIGDVTTLARLAQQVGLDASEVGEVLAGERYAADVRADEDAARALGIQGVPHFRIGARHGLSGAQHPDMLLRALTAAWVELPKSQASAPEASAAGATDAGAACGVTGCD